MATTTDKTDSPPPSARNQRHPSIVPHLSVAERVARGKAAPAEVARSSHAAFDGPERHGNVRDGRRWLAYSGSAILEQAPRQ
jgi:hypothetical protein